MRAPECEWPHCGSLAPANSGSAASSPALPDPLLLVGVRAMPKLYFDIETGSPRSLHENGAWSYAACPDTRVWCACFAVDDREVQSWTPGDPVPEVFTAIAADPTGWEVVAHGIEFDRAIYEHILVARHGFPPLPLDIQSP